MDPVPDRHVSAIDSAVKFQVRIVARMNKAFSTSELTQTSNQGSSRLVQPVTPHFLLFRNHTCVGVSSPMRPPSLLRSHHLCLLNKSSSPQTVPRCYTYYQPRHSDTILQGKSHAMLTQPSTELHRFLQNLSAVSKIHRPSHQF